MRKRSGYAGERVRRGRGEARRGQLFAFASRARNRIVLTDAENRKRVAVMAWW